MKTLCFFHRLLALFVIFLIGLTLGKPSLILAQSFESNLSSFGSSSSFQGFSPVSPTLFPRPLASISLQQTAPFGSNDAEMQKAMEQRKRQRKIIGGSLIGVGTAVTVTSIILIGLAAYNKLPLPGECGWHSGIAGDPCVVDLGKPGTKAAFGVSTLIGLGGIAAGIAVMFTY